MAEDFSACAARIRVTFKQPVQPAEMQRMVESLMTRIALDCVKAGTRLIGHIKCIAEVEAGKYIACSVTTPDGKPRCSSSFGSRPSSWRWWSMCCSTGWTRRPSKA